MWHSIEAADLSKEGRAQLKKLRKARKLARKDARSGNPAKRAQARRAIEVATAVIGKVYEREAAS